MILPQSAHKNRETTDISLSQLYEWQKVLEVPLSELLIEADDAFSPAIMQRAQLVRLMKSALAIQENAKQETIRRMAQTLIDQLLEIMPELAGVGPWHAVDNAAAWTSSAWPPNDVCPTTFFWT